MNTEHSTDGAGTECVRSEYGAQYGRSGYGVQSTECVRSEWWIRSTVRTEWGRSTYGVGMEQTRDGVGAQGVSRYGM